MLSYEPGALANRRWLPMRSASSGISSLISYIRTRDMSDDEGGSGLMGWVIFLLIFGVGNFVLWKTTGIVLIPIRR